MALFPQRNNSKSSIEKAFPEELSLPNLGVASTMKYGGRHKKGGNGIGRLKLDLGGNTYNFEYDVDAEVEVINPKLATGYYVDVDVVTKVNGIDNVRPSSIDPMNENDKEIYNQKTYDAIKEVLISRLDNGNRKDFSLPAEEASEIFKYNSKLNIVSNIATEKSYLFSDKSELDPNEILDPNDERFAYRAANLLGNDAIQVKIDENSTEGSIDVSYTNKGGANANEDNDFEYIQGTVPIEISFKGVDDVKITTDMHYTLNNQDNYDDEHTLAFNVDPQVVDKEGNTIFERRISGIDVLPDMDKYSEKDKSAWVFVTPEIESYDYAEPFYMLKSDTEIARAEIHHNGQKQNIDVDNEFLHSHECYDMIADVVKKHVNNNLPYLNHHKLDEVFENNVNSVGFYDDTPVPVEDLSQEEYLRRTAIEYQDSVKPTVEMSNYPLGIPKGEENNPKYWVENNLEKFARGVADRSRKEPYLHRKNKMRANQWVTITNHQNQKIKAKFAVESYFNAVQQQGNGNESTHRISGMELLEVAVPLIDPKGEQHGWALSDEKPNFTKDLKEELEKVISKNLAEKVDTNSAVFKEGFDTEAKPIKPIKVNKGLFSEGKFPYPKIGTPEELVEAKNTATNDDIAHVELSSLSEGTQRIATALSQTLKNPDTPEGVSGTEVRVISKQDLNLAISELQELSNTAFNANVNVHDANLSNVSDIKNNEKQKVVFDKADLPELKELPKDLSVADNDERKPTTKEIFDSIDSEKLSNAKPRPLPDPILDRFKPKSVDTNIQRERYFLDETRLSEPKVEDGQKQRVVFSPEDLPEPKFAETQKQRVVFSPEDLPELKDLPEHKHIPIADNDVNKPERGRYVFDEADLPKPEAENTQKQRVVFDEADLPKPEAENTQKQRVVFDEADLPEHWVENEDYHIIDDMDLEEAQRQIDKLNKIHGVDEHISIADNDTNKPSLDNENINKSNGPSIK